MIGLVLDRDGFPKAHEVFDGNRHDQTTVEDMLTRLEERTGRRGGATVVVDRGTAFAKKSEGNISGIRRRAPRRRAPVIATEPPILRHEPLQEPRCHASRGLGAMRLRIPNLCSS